MRPVQQSHDRYGKGQQHSPCTVRLQHALAMHLHLPGAGSTSVATTGFLHAGLGDARAAQLLLALRQAAEEAAGAMALVQLAAAAQDAIDAANSPEGDCPICMFPLAGGSSGGVAQKLPCFHCMHRWERLERSGNPAVPAFVCWKGKVGGVSGLPACSWTTQQAATERCSYA